MSLNPADMIRDDDPRGRRLHIAPSGEPPPLIDDPDLADPAQLVIPARDAGGESEVITLKIAPMYAEQLRQVVRDQDARWPWRDVQAAVRWCIHMGLGKIERAKPPEGSFMWMIESMNEWLRHEEYRRIYEEHLTLMAEHIRWAQANDSTGTLARMTARKMYERICNGPVGGDDGFWRDLTKERFLLQYGDYLD